MAKEKMQIGELAERAGVTPRTIRYYESLNLLGPCEREGKGFRYYSEQEFVRLKKIETFKQLGLSLEEIAGVIDLYFAEASGIQGKQKVLEILRRHLAETESKLGDLQRFRQEILANIERMEHWIAEAQQKQA
ncbi:MAG TPA: MerR family transcriptional regulator [Chloroflexia bacterium]|nr:MerR family transcriptional regulator [Chloroflexia bacterium]